MLFSLFLVTFPNKRLYFVCIRYLVVLQWLRRWATLLLNLIVLNYSLGLLFDDFIMDGHPIYRVVVPGWPVSTMTKNFVCVMPIHYDTIEDVQKKKKCIFPFSLLFRLCYFCILSVIFAKNITIGII